MFIRLLTSMILAVTMLGATQWCVGQATDNRIEKAKELFENYVRLEHEFDPAVADLYSDEAVIRNKRKYPTGETRELAIPAKEYKPMVRMSMPIAKLRGDTCKYTDISYSAEGDGVRIKADRYSELKKYNSLISILVKPDSAGVWLIYEELGESQP